jgi:thioredoxin reductase (NADPH)
MDHKVVIIGTGPAGLTAAIYAARANLSPIVIEGIAPGGQLMTTTDVENFPGFPEGIKGPELMERTRRQAARFGTIYVQGEVTEVSLSPREHRIQVEGESYTAPSVVISTGASARYLDIEGELELKGRGVSACATCDGFFFKDREVFVVGGGDSAMEDAIYLSGICRKVTVIHRRHEFRASPIMVARARSKDNIVFELGKVPVRFDAGPDGTFQAAVIEDKSSGEVERLMGDGVFVAIGHTPNTAVFQGQVKMDDHGYIITAPDSTATDMEGVFACGDVQDNVYRQAITAAGTGCMAALEAQRYLEAL